MSDELDPALDAKFRAVTSAPPPDNWDRIKPSAKPTPVAHVARARVLVAVAAGLMVVGAIAAIAATRQRGTPDALQKDAASVATTQPGTTPPEGSVATTLPRPTSTAQTSDVEEARLVRIEDIPFVRVAAIGRWEHGDMWVDNSAEGLCFGHRNVVTHELRSNDCVLGSNPDFQFVAGVGGFGEEGDGAQEPVAYAFLSSRFVEMRLLDSGQELCRVSATSFDGAPEIVGFLCTSDSFELVQDLTYRFVDQDQVLWELDTSASALGRQQPIISPEVCRPTQARTSVVDGITLFARSDTHTIPIQVIADPALGAAGPFAIVERFYETIHAPSGGEVIGVDGLEVMVNVYDNGNGQVTWDLPDGTQGYIRSRGLDSAQLEGIVRSLVPYDVESDRLGFDVVPEQPNPRFRYLAKQLNTEVQGEVHRSVCYQEESQNVYRTAAAEGDVVLQYAMVIDQPVPLDVRVVDGIVVTLSGRDGPTAPTIDDVVDAADDEWNRLLAQPDELALETSPQIPIGAGLDAVVQIESVGSDGPEPSPMTVGLEKSQGVWSLTVYTATVVSHPDGELLVTSIYGRTKGITSNVNVGTAGFLLGDYPAEPFTIEVAITNLADDVLQTTGIVTLVPEPL